MPGSRQNTLFEKMSTHAAEITAPVAKKLPLRFLEHGEERVDDYYWIREKTNPEVIGLLKSENAYTDHVLKPLKDLRDGLFEEMRARIEEDDRSVPYKDGDYFYYWRMEAGKQYAFYCRKFKSLDAPEEIYLDGNKLAEGHSYFRLGAIEASPDHNWLAYAVDFDGSEKHRIYFKNLKTGELASEFLVDTGTALEWANDNRTVFYTLLDPNQRPDRLLKHTVGTSPTSDTVIHQEPDPQFFVGCSKSRSNRFIFLEIEGKVTSEVHFAEADHPENAFQVIEPRRRGIEYSVNHHGEKFFIVTNDTIKNFRLVETSVNKPGASNWKELRCGSETLYIEGCDTFRDHMVLHVREKGREGLKVLELPGLHEHAIEFPEPTYSLGAATNAEFETTLFRFNYASLVTPNTVIDYDMRARTREIKKQQKIPSGYDATKYRSELVYARAHDGTEVPISLVYRLSKDGTFLRDGSHPLYLYGYGSYGYSMSASFSTTRLSLVDRGFVYAIAHIRGGAEMGRQWYDDGKFLKKKNTFSDFISSAEHLIKEGFTSKGEITCAGGSAGGLLVGTVINERPELFKAAVAHVPFVDVVNTMLDESLPLTALEYEEWGNPADREYYRYIKSYSPYDNVSKKAYPHMLVTSGLNDPRVTYWEPAKWVAKLRELKTDKNLILQQIEMEAGHSGPSGRYESLKKSALEYAFLLAVFKRA